MAPAGSAVRGSGRGLHRSPPPRWAAAAQAPGKARPGEVGPARWLRQGNGGVDGSGPAAPRSAMPVRFRVRRRGGGGGCGGGARPGGARAWGRRGGPKAGGAAVSGVPPAKRERGETLALMSAG